MNAVTKNLIINAMKVHGKNTDKILSYLEDQTKQGELTVVGFVEVESFLNWSFNNKKTLGHRNFDQRLAEYKAA